MHYRTFGVARADARGVVRNAVLILHGNWRQRRESGEG